MFNKNTNYRRLGLMDHMNNSAQPLSNDFEDSTLIPGNSSTKIISIVNQKGGCGKTTTAINLASCLLQKGYRVLLIDADPQGQATIGLGIDADTVAYSLYDVLVNNRTIENVMHSTNLKGLDIVPANSLLAGAQLELSSTLGRESILKFAIQKYLTNHHCDYIIVDCSPSLSLITINALVASKQLIIPFQAHYFSLQGMKDLFSTIDTVKERLNNKLEILGILVTLFDRRIKVNHEILGQIKDYFKDLVFNTVIHMNVKLCEAPIYKKPINHYAARSKGAVDYMSLTQEVVLRANSLEMASA